MPPFRRLSRPAWLILDRCDQESVGSFLVRVGLGGFNPDLQHRWVGEVVDCDVGEAEVGSGVGAKVRAMSSTDI